MKPYELTYLISPELSEEELKTFSQKIRTMLHSVQQNLDSSPNKETSDFVKEDGEKENKGTTTSPSVSTLDTPHSSSLIKKRLGYSIKNKNAAYITTLSFLSNPEKIAAIEKELKAETQILRYILLVKKEKRAIPKITKKPEIAPKPSVKPEAKVELKEIDKKLEEILGE